jgi:hypothetical protein
MEDAGIAMGRVKLITGQYRGQLLHLSCLESKFPIECHSVGVRSSTPEVHQIASCFATKAVVIPHMGFRITYFPKSGERELECWNPADSLCLRSLSFQLD